MAAAAAAAADAGINPERHIAVWALELLGSLLAAGQQLRLGVLAQHTQVLLLHLVVREGKRRIDGTGDGGSSEGTEGRWRIRQSLHVGRKWMLGKLVLVLLVAVLVLDAVRGRSPARVELPTEIPMEIPTVFPPCRPTGEKAATFLSVARSRPNCSIVKTLVSGNVEES
uniref:Uncharacterized protein n=1 Tax=Anopheles atroparvus TaxID=41427 RepID=A0A182JHC3_ANOAO